MCVNNVPSRHQDSMNISLFPGQSFEINAVAVGQLFGVVPTMVTAEVKNRQFSTINDLQKLQEVENSVRNFSIQFIHQIKKKLYY